MSSRTLPRLAALLLAVALLPAVAPAAPNGHLGLILNGDAVVETLPSGTVKKLPHGGNARVMALAPAGTAAYFVAPAGSRASFMDSESVAMLGYLSTAPYRTSWPLPAVVQNQGVDGLTWNNGGNTLSIQGDKVTGTYNLATKTFRPGAGNSPAPTTKGNWEDVSTEKAIIVRSRKTGRRLVVFSTDHPEPLFAAVRAARHAGHVKDLTEQIDPTLWKEANNWALGNVVFAADGSRLFFASNVGNGMGAAGNTTFGLFAYDLLKGRLAVLSGLGAQFGRIPSIFELSPDDAHLLMVVSVHDSALDNSSYATVIDLLTQKSREVLTNVPEANAGTNFFSGACWSPDGKYLAISAYFFEAAKVNDAWNGPGPKDWITWIKSAATGATVKRISGAQSPSWAR